MTPSNPATASITQLGATQKPPIPIRPFSDPNLLSPDDASYARSPPRRQQGKTETYPELDGDAVGPDVPNLRGGIGRRRRGKDRGRSGSRLGKRVWKKLLWVNQRECTHAQQPDSTP